MVGLSDIPVVGKAVDMISEAMVNAAYRGLRYVFCYKSLVNDLKSAIENSNDQEDMVSTKVVEEKNNGKILKKNVSKWQEDVKDAKDKAEEFMEGYEKRASWRCIKCVPIPDPLNRFRIGRDAVKKADKLAGLTQKGKDLLATEIAHLPPDENLPKTDGEFQNFQSRKDAYEKIWNSIVSEGGPQILGIYGLPGVGKTRIADQIWKEIKENGIFKKVTKTVVSSEKDLDVKRLQNELARDLNCSLESQDDIKRRASQLKQSIINGEKVLIILDDVWREIPLHDIGIPIGHYDTTSSKGSCKILLTSRKKKVCLDNNCIDPVEITALTDDEAWDMFKDSVGTHKIESLQDESLPKQVCKECGGLPLLIRAVGKALRNMSGNVWKDALEQLEKSRIERIPEIDPEVYACLKLSFDNLVDDDAKKCLLLCSLYPEDAYISTSMLIELGTGSKLLPGGRVLSMVDILKSSSLVLETSSNESFKLHDIIRDVTRSIAVRDYAFSFARCDSRLPANYGSTQLLCLEVKESDDMMNQDIHLIKNDMIHTLWIGYATASYHIHEIQVPEVGSMFVNLRCLILRKLRWEPVQELGELRTLVLDDCNISKTDFSFISEKLETLCIWRCDLPAEPLNIINLKHLRKLQIILTNQYTWDFFFPSSMAPYDTVKNKMVLVANTISSLSSCLEELHIAGGDHNNESQQQQQQQLMEISKLTRLKSLKMSFTRSASPHVEEHIQDLKKVFSNLSEFDISFDSRTVSSLDSSLTRLIYLSGNQLETDTFQILIERAQFVMLRFINVDVSSIFNCNTEAAAFADLKYLYILISDTMEHVARISHRHHQIQPRTCFSQLTTLNIEKCSAMKYLFCNSVAKCLVQLEVLHVKYCNVMEAIVMNDGRSYIDGQQDIIINFPKLKSLALESTPQLKSFYLDNKVIYSTNLFDDKIAFPALEELRLSDMEISDIWGKHYFNDNASSFSKLKSLQVSSCTKMETVIPLAMLHKLQNLEELKVDDCEMMTEIIGAAAGEHKISIGGIIFPKLRTLSLLKLKILTSFRRNQSGEANNICKIVFPNLVECRVQFCHEEIKLEGIEFGRDGSTCQLKSLDIRCHKEIQLPSTWQLQLDNLEYLTMGNCWWQKFQCFTRLKQLKVIESGRSTLFPFSVISSLQQLEVIEISNCALLEGIVEEEDVRGNIEASSSRDKNKKIIKLFQLVIVDLKDLPNLRSFMSGADYECHMPALGGVYISNCGVSTLFTCSTNLQQLYELHVFNCRLLEYIVRDDDDDISKTDDKIIITLSHLWDICLANLPNLRCFMSGADYECHMPALKTVAIDNCGVSTLFTRSTNLQRLCFLEVFNCRLLEYIVRDDDDDISKTDDKIIITLSHIKGIELKNLPNLKSFGRNSSYDFNMPKLSHFTLLQCSQVENFSSLKTSTGRSIKVTSDWHSNGVDVENLNDYIKENRKRDDSNLISDEGGAAGETDDS